MFGRPIYDHCIGDMEAVKKQLTRKQQSIRRYGSRVYIETSHAFLKSYWDLAPEFFPQMQLVHLVRNPLEVARSEANRAAFLHRYRFPFRYYRGGDGKKYFRWSLTGLETIFASFDPAQITSFQWHLIQWIEIENRAIAFLDHFDKQKSCFTLLSPQELNDRKKIAALLEFLNLELSVATPRLSGWHNRTPGRPTIVSAAEKEACREVITRIPAKFLEIFRREPYASREWSHWLCT